ncbi:hypothetical protein [Humibacter sp. RRB41]|uniref:hypothetical protein n=1 Tax=Humibacter sp. RRB41 TaxID=2919946 RepID=UPI001FAAAD47|nr:hypothetical protein [Humibacter sp. RRB41]
MVEQIILLDAEQLVYDLLTRANPGKRIIPETDSDSLGDLPLWQFNVLGDGQTFNGPGEWDIILDINVFGNGIAAAKAEAAIAYQTVWGWASDPLSAIVDGVGWVSDVSDISYFSRAGTPDLTGLNVSQYAASFGLTLRN